MRMPMTLPRRPLASALVLGSLTFTLACPPLPGGSATPRPGEGDGGTVSLDGAVGDAAGRDAAGTDGAVVVTDAGTLQLDGATVEALGPSGGRIRSLAQSGGGEVLYAAGDEYGALFRSGNGGVSFERVALPDEVLRPVVGAALENPDVVVVADGLGAGAWRSVNRGATWEAAAGLSGVLVRRLVAEPQHPGWLYALGTATTTTTGRDGGAVETGGLWLSQDQGANFTRLGAASETVHDVAWHNNEHLAATDRGLLRIRADGSSQSLNTLVVHAVVADPVDPGAFIIAQPDGKVSRVVQSAAQLADLAQAVPEGGLVVRGSEVLVVAADGIHRGQPGGATTTDGGVRDGGTAGRPVASFSRVLALSPGAQPTAALALRGVEPGLVVATQGAGVIPVLGLPHAELQAQASASGLRSAHRCSSVAARTGRVLLGCVVETSEGSFPRVFSGRGETDPAVVSEETALGTAAELPGVLGPVAVALGVDGTAYAAVGSLKRQDAEATTWSDANAANAFFVATHPRVAERLVVGVMDGTASIHRSTDRGTTLAQVPNTVSLVPWQVAFHPSNDDVAYVVLAPASLRHEAGAQRFTLYRTDNFFAAPMSAWNPTGIAADDAVAGLAIPSADANLRVVITERGRVFRTSNEGAEWSTGGSIDGLKVMTLAYVGRVLVAAGVPQSPGVASTWVSYNDGATFQALDVGVPAVLGLAPEAGSGGILFGTVGEGMWRFRPGM
ncbi:MAG: hypothetical protein AB2A00_07915 [Myxococcota bacterium]